MSWLNTIGLVLVAIGIIGGIFRPTIGAMWASDETERREWWLARRYYASIGLVMIGTLLQIVSTWP